MERFIFLGLTLAVLMLSATLLMTRVGTPSVSSTIRIEGCVSNEQSCSVQEAELPK